MIELHDVWLKFLSYHDKQYSIKQAALDLVFQPRRARAAAGIHGAAGRQPPDRSGRARRDRRLQRGGQEHPPARDLADLLRPRRAG